MPVRRSSHGKPSGGPAGGGDPGGDQAQGEGPGLGRTRTDRRVLLGGQPPRRGQPLSAHGVPVAPRDRGGRHPDLPLASRAVRSEERVHLRSLRRRRHGLSGRGPGRTRVPRRLRAPSRPGRARSAPPRGGDGSEHPAGDGQGRGVAHPRRGGPGRHRAGQRPLRSAPATLRVVQRHDDPLGHGQRGRPPRRRRAHRPVIPGSSARGVEHQRSAAASPPASPRKQGDPPRRAQTVVPVSDRSAQRRRSGADPAGRHRGPFEPGRPGRDDGGGGDRPLLPRRRPRHRLHQQGLRAPRPHRLGARGPRPALAHSPVERGASAAKSRTAGALPSTW